MSAFAKGKLKAARDALGKKNYQLARESASQVLDYEPENYNAHVFLALALFELGDLDESEQVYLKATTINADQILAWQGLSKYYERTKKWDRYGEVLDQMMRIFVTSNDCVKCAETVQKIVELKRENASRTQIADALSLYLPGSKVYDVLSALPAPDPTNPTATTTFAAQVALHNTLSILEEIVTLHEKEEEETINREVDKRRMRLGAAGPEQIRAEVAREVLAVSRLPHLYNEVLNHPDTSDSLRRETESKLLRHKQRYLHALPASQEFAVQKAKIASEIDELVDGAVLLGLPDELAWSIFIEGKDTDSIDGYDISTLRRFMEIFPSAPLTKLLRGYFSYMRITIFSEDEESDDDIPHEPEQSQEDALDSIIDAFPALESSILAYQVVGTVYIRECDYPSAIRVAESGKEVLQRAEAATGRNQPLKRKAFDVILATALVHLFPPKHHTRALGIIDGVLNGDPTDTQCLMGRGYILEYSRKWPEAEACFAKVANLLPNDLTDGLRAREECAWCKIHAGDYESGAVDMQAVLNDYEQLHDRDQDKARCWWRLGKCFWDIGGERREEAYRHFITSLKRSSSFAPAFTSLGIYYTEAASPPDPTRASKCFQKAFELDAREADAARKLAEGFADEREWDLVEVVAKRTIEGEGGLDAGISQAEKVAAGRYQPTNAWAWKAVGVVELNRRQYSAAIQAFQIALRAEPDDQLSWLRLGEAYSRAGRHAAAIKALARARELNPGDWMCAYLTAEVHRQMGQYEEAISAFRTILEDRPRELGVLMSLSHTHLEQGLDELSLGFTARAESSFISCIDTSLQVIDSSPGFRGIAWKSIADATFHLSAQASFFDRDQIQAILQNVAGLITSDNAERLSGIISLPVEITFSAMSRQKVLELAIAAYNYRISMSSNETTDSGSSWFDLGAALHYLATINPASANSDRHAKATQQAIVCIKQALRNEVDNDAYWNALGNINFTDHPKTAQHAYIKALDINSKDVTTWTNLGLLYLYHEDFALANEAFYKAQTLDPDYTVAWIGQGLVATANGHAAEAKALFEHAVGLSADVPEGDLEFATRTFSKLAHATSRSGRQTSPPFETLLPVFFVLGRYCKGRPEDVTALHLQSLVCEHIGHIDLGIQLISKALSILEDAYEESEDPIIERQFVIANCTGGRLRLTSGDYRGAIDAFDTAKSLLTDEQTGVENQVLRAQCLLGGGLANFKLGNFEDALILLEEAVEISVDDLSVRGHATVYLAQVLWSIGTDDAREDAKTRLLQCIEEDPDNITAINVLAGMGILTEDDGLVEAALSEILSLHYDKRFVSDPDRAVTHLLIQHQLGEGAFDKAISIAQSAVFAEPSRPEARREASTLALQHGLPDAALAVLVGAAAEDDQEHLRGSLSVQAIANALNPNGDFDTVRSLAQKAVMLSPWDEQNWQALGYARARFEG
ncbi:hypothetical protein JAAARDRAFT_35420 [Jaapia argillacea MUCL 33604]|uniref:Superkiller protein 3 n=1 Tax=Jaapia argillacea MUCL 33604 TaxID=933084 RepID=A0A067Q565_9AGAM|nr:hypothetical protein JAAARDRAFT_35420 [Jaapia argillacea MUCL 33604]